MKKLTCALGVRIKCAVLGCTLPKSGSGIAMILCSGGEKALKGVDDTKLSRAWFSKYLIHAVLRP